MSKVIQTMVVSFFTNLFLSFVKIVAGFIGRSGALIADGIHSFSDLSTDIVAMIGSKLSKKPADEKHPYGHGKIEYITSILISIVILALGVLVMIRAVTGEATVPTFYVAIVSFITILLKFFLSNYIIKVGKQEKNNILLASGYESRSDVFSSIVVFISVLLMQLSKYIKVFEYADVVAMILVSLLIIKIGFKVLKENVSSLLEEQETDVVYLEKLKNILLQTKEIHCVDHLKVLKFGTYFKVDAEVSMNSSLSLLESHRYIHEAEAHLKAFDDRISYVTIHANPDESFELIKAQEKDMEQIKKYRLATLIHDNTTKKEKNKIEKFINQHTLEHLKDYQMILIDGKIIGTIGYYEMDPNTIFLEEIYIEENYRYCGIGTQLIRSLLESKKRIELWVEKDNSAFYFYKNLGFQILKTEETRYRMVK